MCDACFNSEIKSFPTQKDYEEFDLLLTKKIGNERTVRMGQFVNTEWKDIGYWVYECLDCGQLWKLGTPNSSLRGYFLKVSNEEIIRDTTHPLKTSGFKVGVVVFVILVLTIIAILWLRK